MEEDVELRAVIVVELGTHQRRVLLQRVASPTQLQAPKRLDDLHWGRRRRIARRRRRPRRAQLHASDAVVARLVVAIAVPVKVAVVLALPAWQRVCGSGADGGTLWCGFCRGRLFGVPREAKLALSCCLGTADDQRNGSQCWRSCSRPAWCSAHNTSRPRRRAQATRFCKLHVVFTPIEIPPGDIMSLSTVHHGRGGNGLYGSSTMEFVWCTSWVLAFQTYSPPGYLGSMPLRGGGLRVPVDRPVRSAGAGVLRSDGPIPSLEPGLVSSSVGRGRWVWTI